MDRKKCYNKTPDILHRQRTLPGASDATSRHYIEEGFAIYYLEDIVKRYNHALNGLDLEGIGAKYIAEHPRF